MTPIIAYLKDGKLLEGKDEVRKLRIKSARYVLMDEMLYKKRLFLALFKVFGSRRNKLCIEGSS